MNPGDGQGQSPHTQDPNQALNNVPVVNVSSPDKVFGTTMPQPFDQSQPQPGNGNNYLYGNPNYQSPTLTGQSPTDSPIPIPTSQFPNNNQTPSPNQLSGGYSQGAYQQNPNAGPQGQTYYSNPYQAPSVPTINQSEIQYGYSQDNQPAPDQAPAYGSIDYLNSIAPNNYNVKRNPLSNKLFIFIGGALLILVVIISVIGAVGNMRGSTAKESLQLGKDLANLQTVLDYGDSNDSYSSHLAKATAEAEIITSSKTYELGQVITLNVDKKGKKSSDQAEADEQVTTDLDKAKSDGKLEAAYSKALGDNYQAITTTLQSLYDKTSSKDAKDVIEQSYNDYIELTRRLEES